MPRSARPAGCVLGLVGACVLAATIPAAAADAATLKKARATVSARVTVSTARSATTTMSATAVAAVPGAARTIRVTRSASATRTATAAASSAGRKTASARATTTGKARARAKALALKSARAQARARAAALAAAAAAAKARTAAAAAARAAAQRAAETAARQQAAAAASPAAAAPCGGVVVTDTDGRTMTCSFSDEFDGTALDTTKWSAVTTASSGFRNNPSECFVDSPDTIRVSDGTLKLTTRPAADYPCIDHTTSTISGSVSSIGKFSQAYGTFSIRAKFPASTVAGLQSALWMWPNDQTKYTSWPTSGEIDIAERYSLYNDRSIPYLHYVYDPASVTSSWTGPVDGGYGVTGTNVATNNYCIQPDPDAFHTYTMTWRPGQIAISFDGRNCVTNNYAAKDLPAGAPFDQPFFMVLTQALGVDGTANAPTATTPTPATTEVDYVRVWK